MLDADWCYDDSLTAPLFVRLRQLHSFKQMLLSHLEHCPNSMDSVTNVLIHWRMLVVVDRRVDHPRHLVYCLGYLPIQITIPHLQSSHRWTSTCTLKCTPSVPWSSVETPSTVAALLLFWEAHSFSFSRLIAARDTLNEPFFTLFGTHSWTFLHLLCPGHTQRAILLLVNCSPFVSPVSHWTTLLFIVVNGKLPAQAIHLLLCDPIASPCSPSRPWGQSMPSLCCCGLYIDEVFVFFFHSLTHFFLDGVAVSLIRYLFNARDTLNMPLVVIGSKPEFILLLWHSLQPCRSSSHHDARCCRIVLLLSLGRGVRLQAVTVVTLVYSLIQRVLMTLLVLTFFSGVRIEVGEF